MTLNTVMGFLQQCVFWFGTIVASASIIVKATPTQKDDAFMAKLVKVLDFVSIVNANIQEGKSGNANNID